MWSIGKLAENITPLSLVFVSAAIIVQDRENAGDEGNRVLGGVRAALEIVGWNGQALRDVTVPLTTADLLLVGVWVRSCRRLWLHKLLRRHLKLLFLLMLARLEDRLVFRRLLFLMLWLRHLKFVLLTLICGTLISVSISLDRRRLNICLSKVGLVKYGLLRGKSRQIGGCSVRLMPTKLLLPLNG